jgi:hypothetical protein
VKRVAVVAASFGPRSLARALTGRLAAGGPLEGRWWKPDTQVVSLHASRPEAAADAEEVAREHGAALAASPEEAVEPAGGGPPADGVLVVGPADALSARDDAAEAAEVTALLERVLQAIERRGRPAPVFAAPGLGAELAGARRLAEAARKLKCALQAAGALAFAPRLPDVDLPAGRRAHEALLLEPGDAGGLGPSAVDALLALAAGRAGGERGVRAVEHLEGEAVWKALEEGRLSRRLLAAALSRSDDLQGLTVTDGRTQDMLGSGELGRRAEKPGACLVEHADGLASAVLLAGGAVGGHTFAARVHGNQVVSAHLLVPATESVATAACLGRRVADHLAGATGSSPGRSGPPIERALLVAGILEAAAKSRAQGGGRIETPSLAALAHRPPGLPLCRG